MSTKSKARAARRHPSEEHTDEPSTPHSLRGDEKQAAGELIGAVLNLVTLGAIETELD